MYYWLNGHEFKQTPGDVEGQGSLAWYSPCNMSDRAEQLRNNNYNAKKEL